MLEGRLGTSEKEMRRRFFFSLSVDRRQGSCMLRCVGGG